MSIPTKKEYEEGSATWSGKYMGVSYSLNHHGISKYSPQGTWCSYIVLQENLFIDDKHFKVFDVEPEITELSPGSFWETYNYWDLPDLGLHGGITFYERTTHLNKHTGKHIKQLKIGCDYAHSWDRDSEYWQGKEQVEEDIKAVIRDLVRQYPVKHSCGYCGILDIPENFYTAKNGSLVHKSKQSKFTEDHWPMWMEKRGSNNA